METQTELNKAIGTLEPEKKEALEPKKVKIVEVNLRDTKKGKILECKAKHPDREEPIKISSVAYLREKQVVNTGLWLTLDKQENIQKGSALAVFLNRMNVATPNLLVDKEVETELDEKQWLCFKAY
jgi:hypothetical protein